MNNPTNEKLHNSLESLRLKQLELHTKSKEIKENIAKINAYLQNLVKAFSDINRDIIYINEELEKNANLIIHLQNNCVQATTSITEKTNDSENSKNTCANPFSSENRINISTKDNAYLPIQNISIEKPIILREITEYNKFYDAFEYFKNSCEKHGVSIHSSTNLYTLLLSLKRKKLSIKLERDGYEQFCPKEDVYQGCEEWAEKWNKIIFSSDITSKEFMHSLEYIFLEHGVDSIKHPSFKTLVNFNQWEISSQLEMSERDKNELINNHNKYIFIGLYLMHYTMTICDEEAMTEGIVTTSQDIKNRNQINLDVFLTKENKEIELELLDCCQVISPSRTNDSNISEDEKDLCIVFTEDIISNKPSLRYHTYFTPKEEELIVSNDIIFSKKEITNISLWHSTPCHASDEIVILKGINHNVSQEFIFLFLRAFFMYCHSLGYKGLKNTYLLGNLKILIPPKHIQKQIITNFRNDSTIDLIKSMKEIYPNIFEKPLKEVQNLLSKDTSDNLIKTSTTYNSHSYGIEYVKGHYRKGGIYVRGHYRRK